MLQLKQDSIQTKIGQFHVIGDQSGLFAAGFDDYLEATLVQLSRRMKNLKIETGALPAEIDIFERYFTGEYSALDELKLQPVGTEFQKEVWLTLRNIPVGQCWSYQQLAEKVGRPKAMRAVGAANGANPLPVVLPCHRVIGANGTLTGYAGGLERKAWLLQHEGYQLI